MLSQVIGKNRCVETTALFHRTIIADIVKWSKPFDEAWHIGTEIWGDLQLTLKTIFTMRVVGQTTLRA